MTQEFVTLPREVVERTLEAFADERAANNPLDWHHDKVMMALRAALEQPQNHVHNAGNMVPAGWKLVPVEPTRDMLTTWIKATVVSNTTAPGLYRSMLAAAPQPPTTEDPSVVQPQANQPAMTPIAQRKLDSLLAEGYTISGYSVYHEQKHQHGFVTGAGLVGWWKPDGVEYPQSQGEQEPVAFMHDVVAYDGEPDQALSFSKDNFPLEGLGGFRSVGVHPLYTNPKPKREPLTLAQIAEVFGWKPGCLPTPDQVYDARAIEAAHNIK